MLDLLKVLILAVHVIKGCKCDNCSILWNILESRNFSFETKWDSLAVFTVHENVYVCPLCVRPLTWAQEAVAES